MVSNDFYHNPLMNNALNTFRTFPFDYNTNRFVPSSYRSHQRIYPEDSPYYTYNSHPNNYDADAENEHIVANGFETDINDQPYVGSPHYSTYNSYPQNYNADEQIVGVANGFESDITEQQYVGSPHYSTYNSYPQNYDADAENEYIVANGFETDITDQPYISSPHYSTYNSYLQNYNADTDDKHIVGIVNGFETDITDQPYQAGFIYRKKLFCGGSIISTKHILTAGHCYDSKEEISEYIVLVGTQDILNKNRKGVEALVKHFIVHPSYVDKPVKNDIAVVVLNKQLPIDGKRIAKISLPRQDQPLPIGQMGKVSGWGRKSEESSTVHTLNAVHVPILDDRQCAKSYPQSFTPKLWFCAGYLKGGKDFCYGDSGGPLVVDKVVWGIVSHSVGCAKAGHPGVYTNVANYRNWIDKILKQ